MLLNIQFQLTTLFHLLTERSREGVLHEYGTRGRRRPRRLDRHRQHHVRQRFAGRSC